MDRSRKLLVAMQGTGVFTVDLTTQSVVGALDDAIVVAASPSHGGKFIAGTDKGLYASADAGKSWQLKGLSDYKIFSLSFHPTDPNVVYAGTEPALLFRSSDGGETWSELSVKGIAIHPEDPELIYCSIEEGGVIRSLDSGETWRYVSKGEAETFRAVSRVTGVYQDCHVVKISPHDPDQIFVTTGDGLYRSNDCGQTWQRIDRGYRMKKYFGTVLLHPHDANVIYASASMGPPSAPKNASSIYKSTDNGTTFEEIATEIQPLYIVGWNGLTLDPLDSETLYFGAAEGKLYHSADGGESWEKLRVELPSEGRIRTVACAA